VDETTFDEGTLVSRDEVGEVRDEVICRSLGENLIKAMNEANGAVVRKRVWVGFFRDQGKKCAI
jgi:hypothetical protein